MVDTMLPVVDTVEKVPLTIDGTVPEAVYALRSDRIQL